MIHASGFIFPIDHEKQTIFLSQIIEWYEDDFLEWLKQNGSGEPAELIRYIALYLPAEKAAVVKTVAKNYAVRFIPYDWQLNDRP